MHFWRFLVIKLTFYGTFSYKMLIICHLVVFIEIIRSYWKFLIFGHVMGQNSPQLFHIWAYVFWPWLGHFLSNRAEFFLVTQETNIYWLVTKNSDFDAFLENILFLAGKWAYPPVWRQRVWGLKIRPKSWPTGSTFWVNC